MPSSGTASEDKNVRFHAERNNALAGAHIRPIQCCKKKSKASYAHNAEDSHDRLSLFL